MRFDRIPRYTIVGAICAAIYNVSMIAGDAVGLHYLPATLIAFVVIVAAGYLLHCLYTFSERLSLGGFVRYTAVMALTLPLSIGAMFLLRDLAHAPMWIASPVVTVLLYGWNFVATHWAVVTRTLGGKNAAGKASP